MKHIHKPTTEEKLFLTRTDFINKLIHTEPESLQTLKLTDLAAIGLEHTYKPNLETKFCMSYMLNPETMSPHRERRDGAPTFFYYVNLWISADILRGHNNFFENIFSSKYHTREMIREDKLKYSISAPVFSRDYGTRCFALANSSLVYPIYKRNLQEFESLFVDKEK